MNILITGGSSGLGKALVVKLASEGCDKVFFTYCHKEEDALNLAKTYHATAIHVDFRDEESVNLLVERLQQLEIDVLVNNAYSGKAQGTRFHQTTIEDFICTFNNNIIPTIKITQTCLNGMRKRRFGKIVNIITAYVMDVPPVGFSIYTATKAYLRQLSKSISKEYSSFNITSNCILPDYMQTPFGSIPDYQVEQMVASHPLKKLLLPEETADVVISVIKASQQLNGAEIPINAAQHII